VYKYAITRYYLVLRFTNRIILNFKHVAVEIVGIIDKTCNEHNSLTIIK